MDKNVDLFKPLREIQFVDRLRRIGHGRRTIEMRHIIGGVDTRIGTPRPCHLDFLAQQGSERPLERLLHRRHVGLPLPAAIGGPVVPEFQKIAHRDRSGLRKNTKKSVSAAVLCPVLRDESYSRAGAPRPVRRGSGCRVRAPARRRRARFPAPPWRSSWNSCSR